MRGCIEQAVSVSENTMDLLTTPALTNFRRESASSGRTVLCSFGQIRFPVHGEVPTGACTWRRSRDESGKEEECAVDQSACSVMERLSGARANELIISQKRAAPPPAAAGAGAESEDVAASGRRPAKGTWRRCGRRHSVPAASPASRVCLSLSLRLGVRERGPRIITIFVLRSFILLEFRRQHSPALSRALPRADTNRQPLFPGRAKLERRQSRLPR